VEQFIRERIKFSELNGRQLNPTISFGSFLLLNVVDVKSDYDDVTISIHNCILNPLAADYDGDTLNIIPIFDNETKEIFEVFNPRNMMISVNNGEFNSNLSISKDQILGLYAFYK
jgi:hypothetical protein